MSITWSIAKLYEIRLYYQRRWITSFFRFSLKKKKFYDSYQRHLFSSPHRFEWLHYLPASILSILYLLFQNPSFSRIPFIIITFSSCPTQSVVFILPNFLTFYSFLCHFREFIVFVFLAFFCFPLFLSFFSLVTIL